MDKNVLLSSRAIVEPNDKLTCCYNSRSILNMLSASSSLFPRIIIRNKGLLIISYHPFKNKPNYY